MFYTWETPETASARALAAEAARRAAVLPAAGPIFLTGPVPEGRYILVRIEGTERLDAVRQITPPAERKIAVDTVRMPQRIRKPFAFAAAVPVTESAAMARLGITPVTAVPFVFHLKRPFAERCPGRMPMANHEAKGLFPGSSLPVHAGRNP
ncbi:hypothetical protein AB395_00004767 (plasmid) [Sinorhizobium fredii CCBAU 45436]|nr:hypothetical protein AB395_00004767 [Sinorhizobium fredii CCBAU 45436]